MSDEAGAAPAAAESIPAPVETGAPISEGTNFTAPLGSQVPAEAQAKPEAAPKAPSIDEAIDRAAAKSAAKTAEAKAPEKAEPPAKVEAKPAPVKDPESGKFVSTKPAEAPTKPAESAKAPEAPKPSHTAEDAPARFTESAKAKWAAADPEIRGETLRMQRELTEGYQKHREKAEKWDGLKELDDLATKSGTTVKDAMTRYVAMEQKLRGDLIGGLDEIISKATGGKNSIRDVAAFIMGQKPEEVASQQDATIRELKQTVAQLQQQVGGVTQTIAQERERSTLQEVNKFAADHPRFEELADDIGFFMQTGRAKSLSEAYELAERLNPAPAKASTTGAEPEPPAASSAATEPPVHPDKGQKSINGAPSGGLTSPSTRKRGPVPSLDESLDRAIAAAR